jgi:hypothetical protein
MNPSHVAGARRARGMQGQYVPGPRVIAHLLNHRIIQRSAMAAGLLVLSVVVTAPQLNAGQDKKKVPVIDKITTPPSGQNEFNGKVESLDLKNEVLNVQSLQEDDTEIFPIKKTVSVASAKGYRVDISALKPGTNILVYFEQRGDKRKVKEIVVLGSVAAPTPKTPVTPPS